MKKIVLIGPECTGKSTLAESLARHYEAPWVPEYAREYINKLDRPYKAEDLLEIAKGQLQSEDEYAKEAKELLICDTDLRVIKIWEEYKYGQCSSEILDEIKSRKYDLYLFTNIDIPWEPDPLRENENSRDFLYGLYQKELSEQEVPVVEIKGSFYERKRKATEAIDNLLIKVTR